MRMRSRPTDSDFAPVIGSSPWTANPLDGESMTDADTIANTAARLFLGPKLSRGFTLVYGRGRAKAQLRIVIR